MRSLLMVMTALHILPGVFWAGSTFVAATGAVVRLEKLAFWQFGAAVVVILAGGGLFGLLRPGGTPELVLEIGALCALLAAAAQGTALLTFTQHAAEADAHRLRIWALVSQRIAAALLTVTVVCMAIWRYA